MKEEFEDTKGVIRIRISKENRQHMYTMAKRKSTKGQTTIYKTIYLEPSKEEMTEYPVMRITRTCISMRVGHCH
jgi:hypothetical protein